MEDRQQTHSRTGMELQAQTPEAPNGSFAVVPRRREASSRPPRRQRDGDGAARPNLVVSSTLMGVDKKRQRLHKSCITVNTMDSRATVHRIQVMGEYQKC